jgi:plasmid maintenance system antidote protein VapI
MKDTSQHTPLGLWLSEQCRQRREQQKDLARALGVSPGFLSSLIHGHKQWPAALVERLLRHYAVSAETGSWIRAASLVSGTDLRLSLTGMVRRDRERLLADLLALSVPIERLRRELPHD